MFVFWYKAMQLYFIYIFYTYLLSADLRQRTDISLTTDILISTLLNLLVYYEFLVHENVLKMSKQFFSCQPL